MISETHYPDFQDLQAALGRGASVGSPAEAHGALCGMLAARPVERGAWVRQVLGEVEPGSGDVFAVELQGLLEQVYRTTVTQLDDASMGFYLLLPDDEEGLDTRAAALAKWCEGFLYGLGLVGVDDRQLGDGELQEFVNDVSEISRVEFESGPGDEEEEEAYSELVEYIRMGVLLASCEIQGANRRSTLH
jgi:uncharacterized protein YgfB (UPF0149 family)